MHSQQTGSAAEALRAAVDVTTEPDVTPYDAARIWALTDKLDSSTYDVDTGRLGELTDLFFASLDLVDRRDSMPVAEYQQRQDDLYAEAQQVVARP